NLDWPGKAQGLTERESQVVVLAAEGLTNREIAVALFLSPHTVKGYVSQALSKLGLRNRVEAAAFVNAGGAFARSRRDGWRPASAPGCQRQRTACAASPSASSASRAVMPSSSAVGVSAVSLMVARKSTPGISHTSASVVATTAAVRGVWRRRPIS